jgi:hypothetical protein
MANVIKTTEDIMDMCLNHADQIIKAASDDGEVTTDKKTYSKEILEELEREAKRVPVLKDESLDGMDNKRSGVYPKDPGYSQKTAPPHSESNPAHDTVGIDSPDDLPPLGSEKGAMSYLCEVLEDAYRNDADNVQEKAAAFGRIVLPLIGGAAAGSGVTYGIKKEKRKKELPAVYGAGVARGYNMGARAMAEAINRKITAHNNKVGK